MVGVAESRLNKKACAHELFPLGQLSARPNNRAANPMLMEPHPPMQRSLPVVQPTKEATPLRQRESQVFRDTSVAATACKRVNTSLGGALECQPLVEGPLVSADTGVRPSHTLPEPQQQQRPQSPLSWAQRQSSSSTAAQHTRRTSPAPQAADERSGSCFLLQARLPGSSSPGPPAARECSAGSSSAAESGGQQPQQLAAKLAVTHAAPGKTSAASACSTASSDRGPAALGQPVQAEIGGPQPQRLTKATLRATQQQAPGRTSAPSACSTASSDRGPAGLGQPVATPPTKGRELQATRELQLQQPQEQEGRTRVHQHELELRIQELERSNAELERRLDADGFKFLEALVTCEREVEQLKRQNQQLLAERTATEEQLQRQVDAGELRASNLRMERECQDVLQQLDEFEREKEEELRSVREEMARLSRQLEDQEQHYARLLKQAEREREGLLQVMTEEGRELQSRIEKLSRDKEALSMDLAKALARADMVAASSESAGAGCGGQASLSLIEASCQLRAVVGEREALKDEVTNKDGLLELLRSQLETNDRKLRLADMENAMLKSELEVHRRNAASLALAH
mmetsp:Transcript_76345/g.210771  ORF Transcript_76345/g.210771 Transcript_76345/m.210771 type:complete len:577 (+) Transcript_76345:45-1775(+)